MWENMVFVTSNELNVKPIKMSSVTSLAAERSDQGQGGGGGTDFRLILVVQRPMCQC